MTPVPERLIETIEFIALLAMITAPDAEPVAVGTKLTYMLTAWFAVMVIFELPVVVNPVPEVEMAEIMSVELLLLVRVIN